MRKYVVLVMLTLLAMAGCSTTPRVRRVDAETRIDVGGGWNDTDLQIISQDMIDDCLKGAWLDRRTVGAKPVVVIGVVENRSSEHIDTTLLTKKLEAALVASGKVVTVNDFANRGTLEQERAYQQVNATAKTTKQSGRETGADYILLGSVSSNVDGAGKTSVRTYYVDLELVDIESGEKVWMKSASVKKVIQRKRRTW